MEQPQIDPASFRDPLSAVFYLDGDVYRGLSSEALSEWSEVEARPFLRAALDRGDVVGTERAQIESAPWTAVLKHERVPFVSYPYEWSFSMLRDAAALHLELLKDALAEGITMKDGYAYNMQFRGSMPVFIDVTSFERAMSGGPWPGYRQFCQTFLFPLMLSAYRRVPFQPWLRGSLEGIEAPIMRNLLSRRDYLRRGVLRHVVLHSAIQARYAEGATEVREELKSAGFTSELTRTMVAAMLKLVLRLSIRNRRSAWSDYRSTCSYSDADATEKHRFVDRVLADEPGGQTWDLGCNDGEFSRVAARHADYVVAMDTDHPSIDALYRDLRSEKVENILPLVVNLVDPSPGLGWRNVERRTLDARGTPRNVLALALVHHLSIGANVPLASVVGWLRSLRGRVVVEFPTAEDPQVARLLANKPTGMHDDYTLSRFEGLLEKEFRVEHRHALPSATRYLYAARPR